MWVSNCRCRIGCGGVEVTSALLHAGVQESRHRLRSLELRRGTAGEQPLLLSCHFLSGCRLSLTNFTKPPVLLSPPGTEILTASAKACSRPAQRAVHFSTISLCCKCCKNLSPLFPNPGKDRGKGSRRPGSASNPEYRRKSTPSLYEAFSYKISV